MKRYSVLLTSTLLILSSAIIGCGDEQIEGTVTDAQGKPLEGVTIKMEKSRFTATTDSEGKLCSWKYCFEF